MSVRPRRTVVDVDADAAAVLGFLASVDAALAFEAVRFCATGGGVGVVVTAEEGRGIDRRQGNTDTAHPSTLSRLHTHTHTQTPHVTPSTHQTSGVGYLVVAARCADS